ncbi:MULTISPECIES: hypothetical protein [unclassified Chryseobacterium]|nr:MULTISPECIES: hypothetical protein [unclassified Chryseobacterium]
MSTKSNIKVLNGEIESGMGNGKLNLAADLKVKVAAMAAESKNILGDENWNVFADAKGDFLYAEGELTNGLYSGERERYGIILGGGGKAGALSGEITSGYTLAGIRFGDTVGGCIECAEASAQGAFYYDNKKGNLVIRGYGAFGGEFGGRVGKFIEIPVLKFIKLTKDIVKIKLN